MAFDKDSKLAKDVETFILDNVLTETVHPASLDIDLHWERVRQIGTELWLDTGSIADIEKCWTREFSALTTNNTLLNKEVQTGQYDILIL